MSDPEAVLIAGPTASGKSEAAMQLAGNCNGVIINADSMQVYEEVPTLTARPGPQDERAFPHRLYGIRSGHDPYSVGAWLRDVEGELQRARDAGQRPIIVGGTGLYFLALLEGLSPVPDIPVDIRRHWRAEALEKPGSELHEQLNQRDPAMARTLEKADRQRIVRALEVLEATGKSLLEWQKIKPAPLLDADKCEKLVIAPERAILYDRCDRRFEEMLERGALAEVETFLTLGIDPENPINGALGLRHLIDVIRHKMDLETATELSKRDTRRYAKRQMSWLRRNMIAWKWN